jgi:hypothetical protein
VKNPAKVEKLQTDFKTLTSTSTSLNTASDELAKAVSVLDEALKKLNIGLTVWVTFRSWSSERDEYDEEQIGYCKLAGKWGIALRRIWGDTNIDQHAEDGPWLFNDGPREMRLAGVDKIPELIGELSKEASDATKKIQEKTQEVRELAGVIEGIAVEPKSLTLSERIAAGQKSLTGSGKGAVATLSEIMSSLDQGSK